MSRTDTVWRRQLKSKVKAKEILVLRGLQMLTSYLMASTDLQAYSRQNSRARTLIITAAGKTVVVGLAADSGSCLLL